MVVAALTIPYSMSATPAVAFEQPTGPPAWTGSATSVSTALASGLVMTAALQNPRATAGSALVTLGASIGGVNNVGSAGSTAAMFDPQPSNSPGFSVTASADGSLADCDMNPTGGPGSAATASTQQDCADMADLVITFSQPVTNPVVHVWGIGGSQVNGAYAAVISGRFALVSTVPAGGSLAAASAGATNFVASGNTIAATGDLPAVSCSGTPTSPATQVSGCGSREVIGTVTEVRFRVSLRQVITGSGTSPTSPLTAGDLVRWTVTVPQDFSDAPASYNGTTGTNAPRHVLSDLRLGSTVDEDQRTTPNPTTSTFAATQGAAADGDDTSGTDDEDGVAGFPVLSPAMAGQSYAVPVTLSGASRAGEVCGWIDFNRGTTDATRVFDDPSERACAPIAVGQTSAVLTWTLPVTLSTGPTYARFRTSYTLAAAETPVGPADSGEVEDYSVTIAPTNFTLAKASRGAVGTFNFTTTNTSLATAAITTTTAGTAFNSATGTVTATGTAITATEVVPAGWVISSASCVDDNGVATGNGTGPFGSLVGGVLTVPAGNVLAGADITCTYTNDRIPTVTLAKVSNGGTGTFTIDETNTSVAIHSLTTVTDGVAVVGVTATVTNSAAAVTVSESAIPPPFVFASAQCTDANAAVSGNPTTPFAATTSNPLTIPTANLVPGADITCTFVNDVAAAASLSTTKSLASGSITSYSAVGQAIDYDISVTNTGNVPLTGVSVSDPVADTTPVCTQVVLAPGAIASCPARHTISQADIDRGSVDNVATGTGTPPSGPNAVGASNSITVQAVQSSGYSSVKSSTLVAYSTVGEVIPYVITITNTGNTTLTAVGASDPLADVTPGVVCSPTTIAPVAASTCTAQHTVTQADLDAGSVVNTAIASGTPPTGAAIATPTNSVTVPAVRRPLIRLTVSALLNDRDGNGTGSAGESIDYTVVATNVGNVTLTSVMISDPMLGSMTCTPAQPASLAPGAALTCTASHVITGAEVAAGPALVNNASAQSDETCPSTGPPACVSAQALAVVPLARALPVTGSDSPGLLGRAALLTASGIGLALLARRRRVVQVIRFRSR